jgi:plasmid stability protein
MPDLIIRDMDAEMLRQIEARASANGRSLSDEIKTLIYKGLTLQKDDRKLGTLLSSLVAPEDWGDDLVFEHPEPIRPPPDLE